MSTAKYPVSTQLCLTTRPVLPHAPHKYCKGNEKEGCVRGGVRSIVGEPLRYRVGTLCCSTRAVPLHGLVPNTAMYCVTLARDQNGGMRSTGCIQVSIIEYP